MEQKQNRETAELKTTRESIENRKQERTAALRRSHMRSQACVCAVVSREKDGSWTMMSPFEVVDHRACLEGGPAIPRHSQQQSDNRDNWGRKTDRETPGDGINRRFQLVNTDTRCLLLKICIFCVCLSLLPSRSCPSQCVPPAPEATSVWSFAPCTQQRRSDCL